MIVFHTGLARLTQHAYVSAARTSSHYGSRSSHWQVTPAFPFGCATSFVVHGRRYLTWAQELAGKEPQGMLADVCGPMQLGEDVAIDTVEPDVQRAVGGLKSIEECATSLLAVSLPSVCFVESTIRGLTRRSL